MEAILSVINEQFFDTTLLNIIKNLIDIAVISLLIYKFFTLLRGTEAIPIIIGLILISFIYQIFVFLELDTAKWLFSSLSQYIVLILVIIFRDDIRKTLAKIGDHNLLEKKRTATDLQVIEELVKASQILSKKKIGALILIQMEAELSDLVTGEIPIHSNVKKEMIEAIFHHNSPIHDGAVILKNNKLEYAGAFLPLSLNRNIPAHFGTRHRAGIGISEKADVVVLIVSEETGNISIVYKGVIKGFSDANELRESLHTLLMGETKQNRGESIEKSEA
ncbi:diadenylate cyclase CdaA [bacterium]|nr:diadenylate cyclase CdaA [bacterium]